MGEAGLGLVEVGLKGVEAAGELIFELRQTQVEVWVGPAGRGGIGVEGVFEEAVEVRLDVQQQLVLMGGVGFGGLEELDAEFDALFGLVLEAADGFELLLGGEFGAGAALGQGSGVGLTECTHSAGGLWGWGR